MCLFSPAATSEQLTKLLKFWVGWCVLPETLNIEICCSVQMPTSATCSELLKVPGHYTSFNEFSADLTAAVDTSDTGFGLI